MIDGYLVYVTGPRKQFPGVQVDVTSFLCGFEEVVMALMGIMFFIVFSFVQCSMTLRVSNRVSGVKDFTVFYCM